MNMFPQDSRYYGCGSSDGAFNTVRYFTCLDNNGLFFSLASIAKKPDWLKLVYCPNRAWIPEAIEKDNNIAAIPAKRSTKEPPQASASQNMEAKTANIDTHPLPHGTRVMIMTKDGRKVNGTVRWAGELPLEGDDSKKKIPVYGLETVSFLVTLL